MWLLIHAGIKVKTMLVKGAIADIDQWLILYSMMGSYLNKVGLLKPVKWLWDDPGYNTWYHDCELYTPTWFFIQVNVAMRQRNEATRGSFW